MKRYIEAAILLAILFLLLKYPPEPKEEEPIVKTYPIYLSITEETEPQADIPEEPSAPYSFIPLEDELQIHMEALCEEMEIDFFLAAALMESESTFRKNVVSKDGKDIGLFQIRSTVWEAYFNKKGIDIYDPKGNIEAGLLIIKPLLDKYTEELALQCYKCGEKRGLELMNEGTVLSSISKILERRDEWKRKEP